MGHVVRSLELARVFRSRGCEVAGFVCAGDARARSGLAGRGERVRPARRTPGDLARAARALRPDAIVVDLASDVPGLSSALRGAMPGAVLAVLDSVALRDPHFDVMVNLCNHHPRLRRPERRSMAYAEGPRYGILRPAFARARSRSRGGSARRREVLVTFGGADPCRHTARVLAALARLPVRPDVVHVVAGAAFESIDAVVAAARRAGVPVQSYSRVEDMAGLMNRCRFACSGSGTTALELCCLGVPALVLAQNAREARFAGTLERSGAVQLLGRGRRASGRRLADAAADLLADDARVARMSRAGRKLVDGRGAARVAGLVLARRAKGS